MFHRTLDLIGDDDFQRARHRLWRWEQDLPDNVTSREAEVRLTALAEDYNAAVQRQVRETRLKTVFFFIPLSALGWPSTPWSPAGWLTLWLGRA